MTGDTPPAESIRLRVFGGLELSRTDGSWGSSTTQSKRVALLAYLVLATPRGLHRRDALLPLFWPELGQTRARAALRQSVYYLRKSLGVDAFVSEGDETIGVHPSMIDCDALAFEDALIEGDLDRALELYAGEPLAGFHVPDVDPDLDDWFHATAARYRGLAADAARTLAERDLKADPARAAERAHFALRIDPEDETAVRLRIEALDASGDRIGAIKAYEAFAERLEEEYGIEPEAETRALVEEVRSRAPVEELERGETPSEPIPIPRPGRRRRILAVAVAGAGVLLVLTGWLAWDLSRAEEPADDGGIRDPAPVAPFVEPQLGGLHDLRIVFDSKRDGNQEIYAINADGTELVRLTHHPARDQVPRWTPDGRILFQSDRSGNWDVYVIDEDGSNVQRLTDDPDVEGLVAISPDGSTVALRRPQEGDANGLYLMDSDGSNVRRIDRDPASIGDFSPDGRRLVVASWRSSAGNPRNSEIFILDLDGGGAARRLTDAWSYDQEPDWSPDGRKILFRSGREGFYNQEIFVMDADGSNPTNLTRAGRDDFFPRWSPDGSLIIFSSNRAGALDLYVMDADGSDLRRITRIGGTHPDVRGPLPRPAPCLVVNGSFEETTGDVRPPGSDAFEGVPGWRAHDPLFRRAGSTNSPDLFTPDHGVPANPFGYQFPVHGLRYAGFANGGKNPAGATEALGGALRGPLEPGRAYEIRARVSNADALADRNFLEVYLYSTRTGASMRVDTLTSSADQTWTPVRRRVSIAPDDAHAWDEIVFRGSRPDPAPEGYWYVDDVDVCPVD